ncbi:hypothetical protein VST7929_00017 [Vibrio stylophorae]|uniref:Uncharacterized protein n=1 Tax=Vibrio stylophorae TaxID=659351 RepID=A0ABN8DM91_9VIBR|nr:hypothetical protein VST7929_00017 [Vibrio stylophorae]
MGCLAFYIRRVCFFHRELAVKYSDIAMSRYDRVLSLVLLLQVISNNYFIMLANCVSLRGEYY